MDSKDGQPSLTIRPGSWYPFETNDYAINTLNIALSTTVVKQVLPYNPNRVAFRYIFNTFGGSIGPFSGVSLTQGWILSAGGNDRITWQLDGPLVQQAWFALGSGGAGTLTIFETVVLSN